MENASIPLGSHHSEHGATPSFSSSLNSLATNQQLVSDDSTIGKKEEAFPSEQSLPDTQHDRESQIKELARVFTADSSLQQDLGNVFSQNPDSELNPNSPNFNARAWTKALISLQSLDAEKSPQRTSSLAFSKLNVHGFGNPTDYQKSVGNVWLELPNLIRKLGRSSAPRKIEILRNFEGFVEAGEMLVVLGPPGSGCSTLLKTIAGETHGIHIDDESYLNYQGK